MPKFISFDPNVELNGRSTYAFIANMNHHDMHDLLVKHGLDNIDQTQWYSLQKVFDVLTEISENANGSENLVAIGMAAGQLVIDALPPEYKDATAEQWLRDYCEQLYPTRHRNGDPGELTFKVESPTQFVITTHIPYPDDVFYGLFYTFIRHFMRPRRAFVLTYDENVPRREKGGEKTIYHVELK